MKRLVNTLVSAISRCFLAQKASFLSFPRRMSIVNVRCVEGEDSMTICFVHEEKQRKMQRTKTEILGKTLTRIGLSASNKKKAKKSEKTAMLKDNQQTKASLWYNGRLVDENLVNKDAWQDGSVLRIGEQSYDVELNPPTIISLLLPTSFMSGFPIFPLIELDFAEKHLCSYNWFKSTSHSTSEAAVPTTPSNCIWQMAGSDFCYTPTVLDIGCFLKLECTPASAQRTSVVKSEATSSEPIAAGPGDCPFDTRHLYTRKRIEDTKALRIVSYNILADAYAKDEFALKMLYPYCPPYALSIQYRQQLLLKELIGYNADVICLQECGHKLFKNNLSPALEVLGFQGLLCCKSGEVPEGEALFFHRSKFHLFSQHNIVLHESLSGDPVQDVVLDKVSAVPGLFETLQHRNTVAQVTMLKSAAVQDEFLCVVNTHLYFKPNSPHVRLIQAGIILNHVNKILDQFHGGKSQRMLKDTQRKNQTVEGPLSSVHATSDLKQEDCNTGRGMTRSSDSLLSTSSLETTEFHNKSKDAQGFSPCKVAILFCGDFNSNPCSAVYQLLTTGHVAEDHGDWTFCTNKDEHCTTLSLSHNLNFFSACGSPQFTNFTGGFKGTLDYIFADGNWFDVEAVVPLPSEEELDVHVALPSVVLPSDHLALVCDLKWKS